MRHTNPVWITARDRLTLINCYAHNDFNSGTAIIDFAVINKRFKTDTYGIVSLRLLPAVEAAIDRPPTKFLRAKTTYRTS